MSAHNFKVGTALVVDKHVSRVEREEILRLEDGRVYRPTKVQIFPEQPCSRENSSRRDTSQINTSRIWSMGSTRPIMTRSVATDWFN